MPWRGVLLQCCPSNSRRTHAVFCTASQYLNYHRGLLSTLVTCLSHQQARAGAGVTLCFDIAIEPTCELLYPLFRYAPGYKSKITWIYVFFNPALLYPEGVEHIPGSLFTLKYARHIPIKTFGSLNATHLSSGCLCVCFFFPAMPLAWKQLVKQTFHRVDLSGDIP